MRSGLEHVELWQRLLDPEAAGLMEAIGRCDVSDAAAMDRLRRQWDADLIAVAIELARARGKAAAKFPNAHTLLADVEGAEQATSQLVADHKARRFAAISPERIVDLCCGIGGDAMSLTRISQVEAIDRSELRAWMTGQNAGCRTRAKDVREMSFDRDVFHIDPSRREVRGGEPRRLWRYADYRPPPSFIDRLLTTCPDGAIKLGPGVDLEALPVGPDREIEIINERGTLVQAVLWCGRLAVNGGQRTATRLPDGLSFTAAPQAAQVSDAREGETFERFLYVPDPAIERADLLGALCRDLPVREAHPGLGILTSAGPVDSPWLAAYEVLEQMPWRVRKLKSWLDSHDAGIVQVKTRGGAIDTDTAQKQLRGDGDRPYTVFGLRLGGRRIGVIARPLLTDHPETNGTGASPEGTPT